MWRYITHVILTMHSDQLKCLTRELTLVMRKQRSTATVNLVTLYFQLTFLLLSI